MAKKQERFIKIYTENGGTEYVLVDRETGVNYLYVQHGYGGGITPLLNADGTLVVTPIPEEE